MKSEPLFFTTNNQMSQAPCLAFKTKHEIHSPILQHGISEKVAKPKDKNTHTSPATKSKFWNRIPSCA